MARSMRGLGILPKFGPQFWAIFQKSEKLKKCHFWAKMGKNTHFLVKKWRFFSNFQLFFENITACPRPNFIGIFNKKVKKKVFRKTGGSDFQRFLAKNGDFLEKNAKNGQKMTILAENGGVGLQVLPAPRPKNRVFLLKNRVFLKNAKKWQKMAKNGPFFAKKQGPKG